MKLLSVKALFIAVFFCLSPAVTPLYSQQLKTVIKETYKNQSAARASQNRINKTQAKTDRLLAKFRKIHLQLDVLTQENQQQKIRLQNQQQEIKSLREQLLQIDILKHKIPSLLEQMVHNLEQFIQLDLPFLKNERMQRIKRLKTDVSRLDISIPEKYKKIMEVFKIETEYGRTMETYQGGITLGAQKQTVDFLRLGRLALYYKTLDGSSSGVWQPETKQWVELTGTFTRSIKKGIQIAKKQTAPTFLTLAIPASKEIK